MIRGIVATALLVFLLASALLGAGPPSGSVPTAAAATTPPVSAPLSPPASTPAVEDADGTSTQSQDQVTTGESIAASLAVLGALVLGGGVLLLVHRAHELQRGLAGQVASAGAPISVVLAPAAGGAEAAPAVVLELSGPDRLQVGSPGEFVVRNASPQPVWAVWGLDAFEQRKRDPRTFILTPRETSANVSVTVTDQGATAIKPVQIEPAAMEGPFAVRLMLRNWGLVLIAIAVVFGAIALGLTGHLDGGNFVALVAPLAALLGVTAAGSSGAGRGGSGGIGSGGTTT